MALHNPSGPLKNCSGLDTVPRCEPSTYQPISQGLNHSPSDLCKYSDENYKQIFLS